MLVISKAMQPLNPASERLLSAETHKSLFLHLMGKTPVRDSAANRQALAELALLHNGVQVVFKNI